MPFLAQQDMSYWWKKSDPVDYTAFLIVAGSLLALALVVHFARVWYNRGKAPLARKDPFSRSSFRRAARQSGVSDEDARFLEEYAHAIGMGSPEFVFRNEEKLDAFFKNVFTRLERESETDTQAETRKSRLFAIREAVSSYATARESISNTQQLRRNMPLTFVTAKQENYPSIVRAVEPGGIAVEPAYDPYDALIRFFPMTRLTFFFYGKNQQGYQFTTRVRGYQKLDGKPVMVVSHSAQIELLPSRRHERREMNAPCTVYRVNLVPQHGRKVSGYTPLTEKTGVPGTILDISAGGCSIRSISPLKDDEYCKIEFRAGTVSQVAFGRVLRSSKTGTRGGTMHLRFVKVAQKALNDILAYVYDYSQ